MPYETSFVMVKPDHVCFSGQIFDILDSEESGLCIARTRVDGVKLETIQDHYSVHKEKDFFGYMTEYFAGKSVAIGIYAGEDIIKKLRLMIGNTDPKKAESGTVRARFSQDSLELAIGEKRPVRNVIHASESLEEALREIRVWREFFVDF